MKVPGVGLLVQGKPPCFGTPARWGNWAEAMKVTATGMVGRLCQAGATAVLVLLAPIAQAEDSAVVAEAAPAVEDPLDRAAWHVSAGEHEAALQLVLPLAEKGEAAAQHILGTLYLRGLGVPRDVDTALEWLGRAAEQDFTQSQLLLANLLALGEDVLRDSERAAYWYRRAAELGVAEAQNSLGVALGAGDGVEKNEAEAVEWYLKAAEQGMVAAQANLGVSLLRGTGVERDPAQAVVWLLRAAEQGSGWAQYYLGNAYRAGDGVEQDHVLAVVWWRRAAQQGYAYAENNLGTMYARGLGVEIDDGRAAYWLASSLRHGNTEAGPSLRQVLRGLPSGRLRAATTVHVAPDAGTEVIRRAAARELAYVLARRDDWVEVYLQEDHTIGFVPVELIGPAQTNPSRPR